MADLRKATLTAALFLFLAVYKAQSAAILDSTDECILTCDRCYKNEVLLNCANDCLFTFGRIYQHWKNECPYFDADLPTVQQM